MSHDPLCHVAECRCGLVAACQCPLIERVKEREHERWNFMSEAEIRADERAKVATEVSTCGLGDCATYRTLKIIRDRGGVWGYSRDAAEAITVTIADIIRHPVRSAGPHSDPKHDLRMAISEEVEKFRVSLPAEPEVTENYSGGIRSRDDMSWALAMVRDQIREGGKS